MSRASTSRASTKASAIPLPAPEIAPAIASEVAPGLALPKRHGAIIDAAAHVFAKRGFHGASTQDIADQLGIRQASLYYYFRSKEEALRLVCEKGAAGFLDRAREILASPGNAQTRLRGLIHSHMKPLKDRADYVRVFNRERQHLSRANRNSIAPLARGVEACFEQVMAEGIAAREFSGSTDPRLATLIMLGALNAVPFWPEMKAADLDAMAEQIANVLIDGLIARDK